MTTNENRDVKSGSSEMGGDTSVRERGEKGVTKGILGGGEGKTG